MSSSHQIEYAMGIGDHTDAYGPCLTHDCATGCITRGCSALAQSKINGSGERFGRSASSALSRAARPALIGWVENHCTRPSSFSDHRWMKVVMPWGSIFARGAVAIPSGRLPFPVPTELQREQLVHHPLTKHTHLLGRQERHRLAQRGPMALNNHS